MNKLTTDYLIIGSGAVGMAFADTLLSDSDANIMLIDRHDKPGGHWNDAYPFVTLHQPSAFYGVSSKELSDHQVDEVGLNKGLGSLASGAQVNAYFDDVMRKRFLPSGRVHYFPMCDYRGDGRFQSLLTGEQFEVTSYRKRVDATYFKTGVPSTHTPGFTIDENVWFMPLNDLPKITRQPERYVIIGGGKTGIDACLWLLERSVDPDLITWIMPRDGWMLDRRNAQSAVQFFNETMGAQAAQFEAMAEAGSVGDLFDRLEEAGVLVRLDKNVKPRMFHGATISQAELSELRRVKNIIRMGRVHHLNQNEIVLDDGTLATSPGVLHVDCSASAITNMEVKPIFDGKLITPQTVRSYQPVFSASLIAHIEATRETDEEKNELCEVVPLPNHAGDWLRMMIPFMMNQYKWSRDPELRSWLTFNRLDGFSGMVRSISEDDTEKQAIMKRIRDSSMPAMTNLHKLVAQLEEGE